MREIHPSSWSPNVLLGTGVLVKDLEPLPEVGEVLVWGGKPWQVVEATGNPTLVSLLLTPLVVEHREPQAYLDRISSKDARLLANEIADTTVKRILRAEERALVITDLQERLIKADATLSEMSTEPGRDERSQARLSGKAEGVRLALSYVEEMIR